MHVIVALGAPTQPLPDLEPPMSKCAYYEWIFDLLEKLDVDDDHEHDSDYSSNSSGESPNPTLESHDLQPILVCILNSTGSSHIYPTMCLVSFEIASHSNRWGTFTCMPWRPAQNLQHAGVWPLQ